MKFHFGNRGIVTLHHIAERWRCRSSMANERRAEEVVLRSISGLAVKLWATYFILFIYIVFHADAMWRLSSVRHKAVPQGRSLEEFKLKRREHEKGEHILNVHQWIHLLVQSGPTILKVTVNGRLLLQCYGVLGKTTCWSARGSCCVKMRTRRPWMLLQGTRSVTPHSLCD